MTRSRRKRKEGKEKKKTYKMTTPMMQVAVLMLHLLALPYFQLSQPLLLLSLESLSSALVVLSLFFLSSAVSFPSALP